jgi:H+-transporting ATPase
MADNTAASSAPKKLDIDFSEKESKPISTEPTKTKVEEEEEEDEDIDALIEDLESQDGHGVEEEEEETPGGGRVVPEDMLMTDTRVGLTEQEVLARRRKVSLQPSHLFQLIYRLYLLTISV